ncbi:MAG: hypothetical protein N3A60_01790 [Thermanaerothrix sp.]|nr:hypothetical protein [Thermanaerothrix sp.]
MIYRGESILFGVIAPLSGDQSCPEVRVTLRSLRENLSGKKVQGYPIDFYIWDTYSSDEILNHSLVASFSQPTLLASLVLTCNSSSSIETLRGWSDSNFLILTDSSQLIEGINQLDKLAVHNGAFLFIPRSAWMMSIIEKQVDLMEGYDQR